jgi:uncharacterized protein (DUF362 family)
LSKKQQQEENTALSRRDFLRRLATGSAAVGLGGIGLLSTRITGGVAGRLLTAAQAASPLPEKSRIVIVKDPRVLKDDNSVDADVLQRMVDTAVCQLTDKQQTGDAWAELVKPDDLVSLKINCISGITFSTRPEMVKAVVNGLLQANVVPDNIIAWDRTDKELARAGYQINFDGPGVKCFGTDHVGYGDEVATDPDGRWRTQFSRILTERCTALVNLPILKTHGETGITAALKNHMGSHNRTGAWHSDLSAIAYLSAAEPVSSRTRLCLSDALRPLYNAGPGDNPRFRWNFYGIIAGLDPVAHDVVCAKIIQDKRNEVKGAPWPIAPEPTHLSKAGDLGLGNLAWEQIQLSEYDLGA